MKTPERFQGYRTIAEFWKEIEESPHGKTPEQLLLSKSTFMAGVIAMWILTQSIGEMDLNEGRVLFDALNDEINENLSAIDAMKDASTFGVIEVERANQKIADSNTAFFEAEMIPRLRDLGRMARDRGMAMLAAFEVSHTAQGAVQCAQLLMPRPNGQVSNAFVEALGVLNGTTGEEALADLQGTAPRGALH